MPHIGRHRMPGMVVVFASLPTCSYGDSLSVPTGIPNTTNLINILSLSMISNANDDAYRKQSLIL